MRQIILTGDRPTGKLHLGHYAGSLDSRLKFQNSKDFQQFVMIADAQALTDNADNPKKIRENILEVALDYLAIGLDPKKTTIFIQSAVPQLAELNLFFLNLVTVAKLQRNPTVKTEMKQRGFGANVPAGFLTYPVSQAADITAFKATLIPVGEDQLAILEQVNEIVKKFNSFYAKKKPVLMKCKGILSKNSRLPGIDGANKASKSLGNAIYLSDSDQAIKEKVMRMYTDPKHIKIEDPGQIKGNVVFTYLDAFDQDQKEVKRLKNLYKKGGLGDVVLKKYLTEVLINFIKPIRNRREFLEKNPKKILKILEEGSAKAQKKAEETMKEVRKAMMIDYF